MKHATSTRRGRSRGNGKRFSAGKNQTFESTGPDVKIRGTAQQVHEKYLSLARDALSSGDRISAEGFFQYADHYYRLFSSANGNSSGQARGERGGRAPQPPLPAPPIAATSSDTDPSLELVPSSGGDEAPIEAAGEESAAADSERESVA